MNRFFQSVMPPYSLYLTSFIISYNGILVAITTIDFNSHESKIKSRKRDVDAFSKGGKLFFIYE